MTPAHNSIARPRPRALRYESILAVVVFYYIFVGSIGVVEPSPADFASLLAVTVWLFSGFSIHRALLPIIILWLLVGLTGFASVMPYWDDEASRYYQIESLYLLITVFFFTIYFSENSVTRAENSLRAYTAGAVAAALFGTLAYLNVFGLGVYVPIEGRVAGMFKDPNVYGSYLILAANYLLHVLLVRRSKYGVLVLGLLMIVLSGIFLSFSRGSWGALVLSFMLVTGASFFTTDSRRIRRRIIFMTALMLALAVVALLFILTIPDLSDFLSQRVKVTQDYDEGVTGRFGNQLRAIPMLFDRFWGFGPLRFRLIFDLDPHNSYVGAFANNGWIGGLLWIGIVLTTCFVGFRLMARPSPVQKAAQVYWPALFVLLLQGFQIDIDHWRHLFLCFGAVWGLEAARQRWEGKEMRPRVNDRDFNYASRMRG